MNSIKKIFVFLTLADLEGSVVTGVATPLKIQKLKKKVIKQIKTKKKQKKQNKEMERVKEK